MARARRSNGPLDLRAQAILRAVIEEYVASATPVGSAALVERYGLGVSSATVRNILADLESAGLLTHPHTSAGRVPPVPVAPAAAAPAAGPSIEWPILVLLVLAAATALGVFVWRGRPR